MRYRMRVTRLQTSDHYVSAADEQSAIDKVRAEMARPYGFLGAWKDADFKVEVLEVESRLGVPAATHDGDPLLFDVKNGAERLGVNKSMLYELIRAGEIEHIRVGSRVYVSRTAMDHFIEQNSRVGYS